jgi:BirA family transcriptional regulator, biotin operon repressor / biotin---[acetyl-CoA-carboxylase] ligase
LEIKVNNTFFTGKFLLHLPSVDSTNNFAKNYIAKNSPIDGTVILADEQYAGRGQSGNTWLADANKNLTFSLIYHTSFLHATEQFWLNMAVSLGIWSSIHSITQQFSNSLIRIKWPNDIYVNDRKIAGLLIENTIVGMHLKYSVIGIGLNVNQDAFPESISATSLKLNLHKELALDEVLNQVLGSVEKYFLWLKERRFNELKAAYLKNLYRYNEVSKFKRQDQSIFEGCIKDVDVSGNLILDTKQGLEKFGFKQISFI